MIGNFIILELSPLKLHHEIPCYWVKFHAIINFTREAQVIPTYVRTYAVTVLPYTLCTSYHGTSCGSSMKVLESSSESFTRNLKR